MAGDGYPRLVFGGRHLTTELRRHVRLAAIQRQMSMGDFVAESLAGAANQALRETQVAPLVLGPLTSRRITKPAP